MRLTFSRALVDANNAAASQILKAVADVQVPEAGELITFTGAVHSLSVSEDGLTYEYVIDDSVLTRILTLYVRAAQIMGPVVRATFNAFTRLKEELMPEVEAINEQLADIGTRPTPDPRDWVPLPEIADLPADHLTSALAN